MKIHSWIAAAAIAAAAAPAAAQNPASSGAAQKVTVVGCVERADQILSRETLGTTVDSLSFVLVKAEDGKAADRPQQPAAPAGQQAVEGKTYRLDVDVPTINSHVGHRVEITATRAQDAPIGTTGRADATASNTVPILKVESVKMLSSTCGR